MKCRECSRERWCWMACDEVAARLAEMEDVMDAPRTVNFMAWVTVLFIMSVAVASCTVVAVPDDVNARDMRGAARYQYYAAGR